MKRSDRLVWFAVIPTIILVAIGSFVPAIVAGSRASTGVRTDHWAFSPPTRPEPPAVRDAGWPRNPIDGFILAGLESEGLRPAPEADRRTLIRRLSLDLIGLPPSPDEVAAFVEDRASDAYERLVDRLLASPHYGERQAQHWLDLARYADTDGFEFDQVRPEMWRYRDWVVSALNRDLPYDRFVRMQIAGDEAAPDDPDGFIATGFNRLYPDMVDLNDQGLRRQNALNDITETAGSVFLGLTIGCARCHDHKTDPIKQRDFYALQAFFAPALLGDDRVNVPARDREDYERKLKAWEAEVATAHAAILRVESPARERIADGPPPGISDEAARTFARPEAERDPREVRLVFEATRGDRRVSERALARSLRPDEAGERTKWLAKLDEAIRREPAALPRARGLAESPGFRPATHILKRGDYASKGVEVAPAFPIVLAGKEPPRIEPRGDATGRRSALADWLVRPDNPLTSRVMVNRLWQGHFGRGLVATPGDFGVMGDDPSHPELLDWLAIEFVARGWSMKGMHRLIVTSATYRQGSRASAEAIKADPDDSLLSRFPRRRLDGESLRDAMLAASGRLNRDLGGPCIFPELPKELMALSGKGAAWPVSPREGDRNRRSLYVFLRRNMRYPLLEAFDKPDTNASCPKRPSTTIAPQALSLMNGGLATSCARSLAERAQKEASGDVTARVARAYLLALGRLPDGKESRLAEEFLREGRFGDFCLALLNLNEFLYVD